MSLLGSDLTFDGFVAAEMTTKDQVQEEGESAQV